MVTVAGGASDADFSTEAVHTLPPGCEPDAVTSDGHVLAFWTQSDGSLRFVWDSVAGEPFDGIVEMRDKTAAVFVSDDGAHVAYVGMRGGGTFVGRDSGEDPPTAMFSRSVPPVFSRGGRHLAYGAEHAGEVRLIVDGKPVGDGAIAPIQAVFSPDGERLAYAEIRHPSGGTPELRIVLDGVPGAWFAGMRNAPGAMQFSPDSRRFAYCRIDGQGHSQWVIDDVAQRLANEVRSIGLAQLRRIGVVEAPALAVFSPDSRRFAYCADIVEKGVAVIEDDVPGPAFDGLTMPVFSRDSRHLAYGARTFSKTGTVVVDGRSGPEWPETDLGIPVFSENRHRVAVTLHRQTGSFLRRRHRFGVAVDGKILADVEGDDASESPVFDPDGDRVAWWVAEGDVARVMVDGQRHLPDVSPDGEPVFTASGRLAYAGTRLNDGKATVFVDGRTGPLADELTANQSATAVFEGPRTGERGNWFAVSPDGEHVAWAGVFGDTCRPVLDDRVGPGFEEILATRFLDEGSAVWWARQGEIVYRVVARTGPG